MSETSIDRKTATDAAVALDSGRLVVLSENSGRSDVVELPSAIRELVAGVLEHARRGESFRVVTDDEEITTGQAAEILNVSRPHLVGLVDAGAIPSRKVGSQRRLRMIDVLRYRDIATAHQTQAARDLAEEAQQLGLY